MIQKLRRLLGFEGYEEALHNFADVVEKSNTLKIEIDSMAKEYLGTSKGLNDWLGQEKETETVELIKSQQDGLTSRYLSFLAEKQKEYRKLEELKKSYISKYPNFEQALVDLKKSDFIENTLMSYRQGQMTLEECDMIVKAITKGKVQYADSIVFNQNGEVLIVQAGPMDPDKANLWGLPGGHVELNEDPCKASKRELQEETGYEADDCWHIGEFDDANCHIDYYISMIDTDEQEPIVDEKETRMTKFVPVERLYDYPTHHDIWDKVYEILGIEEKVVKVKKAIADGLVKNTIAEGLVDIEICKSVDGKEKKKAKFKKVMDEWKSGTLKSGGSGDKVVDRKQAIAIALSESGQSMKKAQEEELHGGEADNKSLSAIAKKHGVDIESIMDQYRKGLQVEKEHTDDPEERSEITKDHLWEMADYYTRLGKMEKEGEKEEPKKEKSIQSDFSGMTRDSSADFEKAKALGHLVPKKVQIKGKDGKVHLAIRWVNPQTGEPEKYSEGLKEDKKVKESTFEDTVAAIAASNLTGADKLRNLVDLGIYDPKLLTLLTGRTIDAKWLEKQVDINIKDLPDNSESILKEVRAEQANNDTPEDREKNKLLMRNPEDIELLWYAYRNDVKTVLSGDHKLCIAYGTGGVGKTFNAMKVIENYVPAGDEADFKLRRYNKEIQPDRDQYDYVVVKGRISVVQVYAEMYRHRDKIIVFDDCDSFMAEKDVQGFLKGGLDTSKDCEISNLTGRKIYNIQGDDTSGEIPDTFKFKGGVIAITNLQIGDFKEKAVITRSLLNNLAMTTEETLRIIAGFKDTMELYSADKSRVIFVSQENRDLAFNMLTEQRDSLAGEDVNARMYGNMAIKAQKAEEDGLSRDMVKKVVQLYIDGVSDKFTKQMKAQTQQTKSK